MQERRGSLKGAQAQIFETQRAMKRHRELQEKASMSKGIYIGLGSMIFLALVAGLVLFSTWQTSNVEDRLIGVDKKIAELKSMQGDVSRLGSGIQEIKDELKRRPQPQIIYQQVSGGGQTDNGGGKTNNVVANPTVATPNNAGRCTNNLLTNKAVHWHPSGDYDKNASLIRVVQTGSKGFNPLTENGADVSEIEKYINLTLAERNPDNPDEWLASAADCIEVNDDFTEYTVHLRRNLLWQRAQGEYLQRYKWLDKEHPLTSDDFVYTFNMIMDPAVEGAASLKVYYSEVERFEKIDDYTFKVVWKKKIFLSKSSTLGLSAVPSWIYGYDTNGRPYPKASRGQNFNQHWYRYMLGVGPYRMDSFKEGEFIKLIRNEKFYGEPGAFSEIIYKIIKDQTQRQAQFENKEIDVNPEISPAQYAKSVRDGGPDKRYVDCTESEDCELGGNQLGYAIYPRMAYRYIGWNLRRPFFSDKRVRRAMTHALNRRQILKQTFSNLGVLTTGNFYLFSSEYNRDVEPFEYDIERAKQLLDEAGWIDRDGDGVRDKDDVKFEFTILVYSYRPAFVELAKNYRDDLAKIGITMKVELADWQLMQTRMGAKEFDAFTGGWGLSWESDPYQIWHSSQADLPRSSNSVGFKNEEADKIIEEARVTFDPDKRIELFHRFHAIIHDEQPYTFLFADKGVGAWQTNMRHMTFQKIRPHDLARRWGKVSSQP